MFSFAKVPSENPDSLRELLTKSYTPITSAEDWVQQNFPYINGHLTNSGYLCLLENSGELAQGNDWPSIKARCEKEFGKSDPGPGRCDADSVLAR